MSTISALHTTELMLEISPQLGQATVSKYIVDGAVCPSLLRKGLFTTAAMDNIDHIDPLQQQRPPLNHGTSISTFHHPIEEVTGKQRGQLKFEEKKGKTIPKLPDSLTNIHPAQENPFLQVVE
jgi:hypothetical protein